MDLNAEMDLNECEIDLYVCEDFLKVNMDLSEIDPEVWSISVSIDSYLGSRQTGLKVLLAKTIPVYQNSF